MSENKPWTLVDVVGAHTRRSTDRSLYPTFERLCAALRGRICFHRYTAWSDPVGSYSRGKIQWRSCVYCNKAQHRRVGDDGQVNLPDAVAALHSTREEVCDAVVQR
jgi:hypothetical protein